MPQQRKGPGRNAPPGKDREAPTTVQDHCNQNLEAALAALELGLRPLPINPRRKFPAFKDFTWEQYKHQAPTEAEVLSWWERWPHAEVGIVTGHPGGLCALDVDKLPDENGKPKQIPNTWPNDPDLELPVGCVIQTPSGGKQYLFASPEPPIHNTAGEIAPGVDVRGLGGLTVVHGKGRQIVHGSLADALDTPCPGWLLDRIREAERKPSGKGQEHPGIDPRKVLEGVPDGERDDTLYRYACRLRAQRLDRVEAEVLVLEAARHCKPAFPEGEARAKVESAWKHPPGKENGPGDADTVAEYLARLTTLDQVAPEAVAWLWPSYIPRSKLTIFGGDPGAGKTFAAIDLVARLTRGAPWPDGTPSPGPVDVVFLTYEDGLADTLRPRLEAAGADLSRVHVLEQPPGILNIDALRAILSRVGPALLVLDPINGFLTAVESNRASEVRPALQTLALIAREFDCAVVGVHHLNKPSGGSGNALYRLLGSIEFSAVARSILGLQVDTDTDQRTLVPIKTTLCAKPPGWELEIRAGKIHWLGTTEESAADVFDAERGTLKEAVEFWRELTANGRVETGEAQRQATLQGFKSWPVVRRAARRAGVWSRNDGGSFYWEPIPPGDSGNSDRKYRIEEEETTVTSPSDSGVSGVSGVSGGTVTAVTTVTLPGDSALFGQEGDNRPLSPLAPVNGHGDDPDRWPLCGGCDRKVPHVDGACLCPDCAPWGVAP